MRRRIAFQAAAAAGAGILCSTMLAFGLPEPFAVAPAAAQTGFATRAYTPPNFRMPEGSGCAGAIARWQAIQANDYATGNINPTVYRQIQAEIAAASSACSTGRDREAQAMIAASRRRHGYPAN